MHEHTLLDATTASGDSLSIQCTSNRPHIHFMAPGMANGDGESVVQVFAGGIWSAYYIDGVKQTISMDIGNENTGRVVTAFGTYRVVKPATTASVPVIATGLT